jgi:exosortase
MNSTAIEGDLPSEKKEWLPLVSAVFVSALILGVLYAGIDYTTGYGQHRVSIFTQVKLQWGLEDWSHCMMVPFAALLIVYLDRAKLLVLPLRGSTAGLPVLFFGFLLYWFGFKADNIYFSYLAFEVLLAGMILWFGGRGWMRALAFPWAFLVFMWPLLFLESFIAFPLRMMVSHVGVVILNIIGIPSVLNGTGILSAADTTLNLAQGQRFAVDVALPCSGMRSLFALLMVSALYGYFSLNGALKRWVLFLAAVPLAIAGNICRIVMLTIGTIIIGSEKAIGTLEHPSFFHMLAGYVVFIVALGGMFGVEKLLTIQSSGSTIFAPASGPDSPAPRPAVDSPEGDLY